MHPSMTQRSKGFALLEALITILILAFGMLSLAGLQVKIHAAEMEAYQRAQALILLNDMVAKISANRTSVNEYVAEGAIVGEADVQNCDVVASAKRDICEWNNALKGSSEKTASSENIGAMISARGCIEQISASPVSVRVVITWQGLHMTKAPAYACAKGIYGDDSYRRAISQTVTFATLI